jgi:hypothetical protein
MRVCDSDYFGPRLWENRGDAIEDGVPYALSSQSREGRRLNSDSLGSKRRQGTVAFGRLHLVVIVVVLLFSHKVS